MTNKGHLRGQQLLGKLAPFFSQKDIGAVLGVSDRRVRHFKAGYEPKKGKRVRAEMSPEQYSRLQRLASELKGKIFYNRRKYSKDKKGPEGRHYRFPLVIDDVFQEKAYLRFMKHLEKEAGKKVDDETMVRIEVIVRCMYNGGLWHSRKANTPIRGVAETAVGDIDRILTVWIKESPLNSMYVEYVRFWRYRR